ncbi:MAG: hypothetical protein CL817_08375 [Croceibacter sp.]|nr:hypothetical protein [Croceibacter sp.]
MKTIKLILLAAIIACTTASCSSDDDSNNGDVADFNTLIIGQWRLTSEVINGEPEPLDDCETSSTITFSEDTVTSVYVYTNDENECETETPDVSTYTISGNTVTISYDGGSDSGSIETLNNSTLTFSFTDSFGDETEVFTTTYTRVI